MQIVGILIILPHKVLLSGLQPNIITSVGEQYTGRIIPYVNLVGKDNNI